MYEISEIQSVDISIFDFDDLKSHKILYDFDLKIWIISYESYGPPFCIFFWNSTARGHCKKRN